MFFFNELKSVLSRTSKKLSIGIESIFKKKVDLDTLNQLEELLISADVGVQVSEQIVGYLKTKRFSKETTITELKLEIAFAITSIIEKFNHKFELSRGLNVVLLSGVNGNGKTTVIGKLASLYTSKNKKIAIAACDTFRAAANQQITKWAEEAQATLFTGQEESDPTSVAYKAIVKSYDMNVDMLLIDTAGRLHNQKNLMNELAKIVKVTQKMVQVNSYHTLLVIDATTGQNALLQTEEFKKFVPISGLVITKLDGTAKAGITISIVEKHSLPVYFIGTGEKAEDLKAFNPKDFARALVDIDY